MVISATKFVRCMIAASMNNLLQWRVIFCIKCVKNDPPMKFNAIGTCNEAHDDQWNLTGEHGSWHIPSGVETPFKIQNNSTRHQIPQINEINTQAIV